MYCKNCGKKVKNSAKFCKYCGTKLPKLNKKNKFKSFISDFDLKKSILVGILIFILGICSISSFTYIKSPEFVILKTILAIKNNDYDNSLQYLDVEKIVDNGYEECVHNLAKDSENPYAIYMFQMLFGDYMSYFETDIKSKMQDAITDLIEDPNNMFQDISGIKLFLFTIIKNHNEMKLTKTQNNSKNTIFRYKNKEEDISIKIVLDKNKTKNWQIVEISGYDFWNDYINKLE